MCEKAYTFLRYTHIKASVITSYLLSEYSWVIHLILSWFFHLQNEINDTSIKKLAIELLREFMHGTEGNVRGCRVY